MPGWGLLGRNQMNGTLFHADFNDSYNIIKKGNT